MNAVEQTAEPRQLVVLSGKGGTGKTSLVASLGALASSKVLADCDVDAPDLHLLLDPQTRSSHVFRAGKQAYIHPEHCSRCGDCALHCRFDAIRVLDSGAGRPLYAVDPISCEGCALCSMVCTTRAVEMLEPERGEWFVSDTRFGPLVHARLNIGGENSGKLVTLVRNSALTLATECGANLVIVDGPPGVGCPVIASITGSDLVLAVTEPTVSGLHDLERLHRLVETFAVPMVVCINKWDINPHLSAAAEDFCASREIEVIGRLPYDAAVVQAQVQGSSIVELDGSPVSQEIRALWRALESSLKDMKE